jgi:hypothetical protein
MSTNTQVITSCICLIAGGGMSLGAEPRPDAKWRLGAPIVTYWAGPAGTMTLDDRAAAQIRAGGWNLGWANTPADLDILYRHGIRGMLVIGTPNLDDAAQTKAVDALIEQVRTHPALYAYHLVDEPGAGAFQGLGKLVAYLRQRDPAHL